MLLRGGFGAVAKPATDDTTRRQARSEVAAYLLACSLGWDDLIPVTVYRTVPSPAGDVEASVQILWPKYETAAELGIDHAAVSDDDAWRIATIDVLIMNSDRNPSNWGLIAGARVGLIDHGHTLIGGHPGLSSEFATHRMGQDFPEEVRDAVDRLVSSGATRLRQVADQADVDRIVDRAVRNLSGGVLSADG